MLSGMSDTPTFLGAVRARRAEIAAQQRALEEEDDELAVAERVAERLEPSLRSKAAAGDRDAPNTEPTAAAAVIAGKGGLSVRATVQTLRRSMSQPELIVATLRASADPWFESSAALHDEILRIHGVDIKGNSLLPSLTGMKKDGLIIRNGPRLALAERVPPHAALVAILEDGDLHAEPEAAST
jgi:hypothetical protein